MNMPNLSAVSTSTIFRRITTRLLISTSCLVSGLVMSATPTIPANLEPAATEQQALRLVAIGVQIYECKAIEGKPAAWAFVAPEADLFDTQSFKRVGKHYAGPHWEMSGGTDSSKVIGTVKQRAEATNIGAIPWLLLSTKSVGGAGQLERVTSIQRLNTVGGVAPETGCTQADMGKQSRVYYSADYVFFIAK